MRTSHTLLRLGVFILVALPAVQCQTGASTPPTGANKTPAAATKPLTPAEKKAAEAAAKKAADEAANKKTAEEATKKAADAAKTTAAVTLENARLDAMDSDYANISLHDCVPGKPDPTKIVCDGNDSKAYHVKVNDKDLRAHLKQFHVGDHLRVDLNGNNELQDLHGPWSVPSDGISPTYRFLVLAGCALVILGLATAATWGSPLKFIVGMDHRYSNSKTQVAMWFWVVMSTYLATVVLRVWYAGWDFFGAVSIPQNLLVLSGLSAITFGGAKAITTAKVNAAANPVPAVPGAAPPPAIHDPKDTDARVDGQQRFFQDLLQNDAGDFDFGDFQMLVVTLIAAGMYMTLIFHFLGSIEFLKTATLPDVDSTILAGFGLGHGAYLAKKAGGNVGTS
jgi:hypothetical protein